ncbi:hypothetical protein VUR80DRAFT_396 [Thermomyces stellatus]
MCASSAERRVRSGRPIFPWSYKVARPDEESILFSFCRQQVLQPDTPFLPVDAKCPCLFTSRRRLPLLGNATPARTLATPPSMFPLELSVIIPFTKPGPLWCSAPCPHRLRLSPGLSGSPSPPRIANCGTHPGQIPTRPGLTRGRTGQKTTHPCLTAQQCREEGKENKSKKQRKKKTKRKKTNGISRFQGRVAGPTNYIREATSPTTQLIRRPPLNFRVT